MNEWINPGMPHTAGRAQVLDASKAQLKNAIVAEYWGSLLDYPDVNVWFFYTQAQFVELLTTMGVDSSRVGAYPDGLYIRMIYVG